MTVPPSQKHSVKQEGRVCQWFSLFLMLSTARRGMMLNLFLTASVMPEHWSFRVESVQPCSFLQILLKERGGGNPIVLALTVAN